MLCHWCIHSKNLKDYGWCLNMNTHIYTYTYINTYTQRLAELNKIEFIWQNSPFGGRAYYYVYNIAMPSMSCVNIGIWKLSGIYSSKTVMGLYGTVGRAFHWELEGTKSAKLSIVNIFYF